MNTFNVTVERGTGWWVAQLQEDPGLIVQTRRLDQVADEVRDALTLFPELTDSPDTADIRMTIVGSVEQNALKTREQLAAIREEESNQLKEMARHAEALAESGYNYRDIAYLLGITYGRVGQIIKQQSAERRSAS